jgi:hypothetical protein
VFDTCLIRVSALLLSPHHARVYCRTRLSTGTVTTARTRLLPYTSEHRYCHHSTHASAPICTWTAGPSVVTATTILSPVCCQSHLDQPQPLQHRYYHDCTQHHYYHDCTRASAVVCTWTIRSCGSTHASTAIRTRLSTATATTLCTRLLSCTPGQCVHLASRSCGSTRVLTIRSCGSTRVSAAIYT